MPTTTPMQALTKRLNQSIEEIKKYDKAFKYDAQIIRFMQENGVVIHDTALSKWKSGAGFPTIEQVLFICNNFKQYASANWIIYGREE